ncbi:MAG: IPT/TIG domain-containing protein [Nitrospiria bacterium]
MTTYKNSKYFVSALLCLLIVFTSINLINCGGGGNGGGPMIYSISPTNASVTAMTGASPTPSAITLIGSNFGMTQGSLSHVYVDKVETGTASTWSDTTIVANLPAYAGLVHGQQWPVNVVVSVNGLVSPAVTFTYIGS